MCDQFAKLRCLCFYIFTFYSILISLWSEVSAETPIIVVNVLVFNYDDRLVVPGRKVDVNWNYVWKGRRKQATPFVRSAEIVNVEKQENKSLQGDGLSPVEVSLSVTEKQAQFFEVAKGIGKFSLVASEVTEDNGDLTEFTPKIIDLDEDTKGPVTSNDGCTFGPQKYMCSETIQ